MKVKVSKFLSYILRHHPEKFNLVLDVYGYTDLNAVLHILNNKFENIGIDKEYIEDLIHKSDKKRFELSEDKIRALYGHSINKKIHMKIAENPPRILYHGTTSKAYKLIKMEGLKRRNRQYVHLSEDMESAYQVGTRRTKNPVMLQIDVKNAINEGIQFYQSGNMYLADSIPAKYIEMLRNDE